MKDARLAESLIVQSYMVRKTGQPSNHHKIQDLNHLISTLLSLRMMLTFEIRIYCGATVQQGLIPRSFRGTECQGISAHSFTDPF